MIDFEIGIPLVPLRGVTVLPGMKLHIDLSRIKSLAAVERAMTTNGMLMFVTQKDPELENPTLDDLYTVGCLGLVRQITKLPNKVIRIYVEGRTKAQLVDAKNDKRPFLVAQLKDYPTLQDVSELTKKAMLSVLQDELVQLAGYDQSIKQEFIAKASTAKELDDFIALMGAELSWDYEKRQKFLECNSIHDEFDFLEEYFQSALMIAEVKANLTKKVRASIDKNQRNFILREQMHIIEDELGEEDSLDEVSEFLAKTEALEAPDYVKEKLRKEIRRYKTMSQSSSESSVCRTYIENLLDLPWNHCSEDKIDLDLAKEILDRDHYGLTKVKERLLEYLSVRTLTGKGEAPILCFVGPPGTGKTSIAKSIAEACNREYVRICLGGVSDEAEIRGHRRTYVGSMPGRIVEGIRQAGVANPLMLLDEIDKVGRERVKGDTESALLEVLDSAQNEHFRDHYLGIPMDLSNVLFIATANDLSGMSKPLLDRLEVIDVSGYTTNEKFHIAKEFLYPKQLVKNGLKKSQLSITDSAIRRMITGYTREAGVRELERQFGTLARKTARVIVSKEANKVRVNEKNLPDYLGKEKYLPDLVNKKPLVGIVRGLAWTSVGGETLSIEVITLPGKGDFYVTGQLGDVMKESGEVALNYVKSIASKYKVRPQFFEKNDIHLHIPEGAVPKDGPSAGITMAVAFLSAATGIKVRPDVVMTGEITLRGQVLAIGGLKEKLLAGITAGACKALVPEENRRDVEELDAEIRDGIEIVFVKEMKDVLKEVLLMDETHPKRASKG